MFVRLSRLITGAVLAFAGTAAFAEAPARVVSLNVCTDQLAMMVAREGQLYSLSPLATDPRTSAMYRAAEAYHINSARAEEIYLMKPDLVLAGTYTARSSVEMLERLGLRVERFAPSSSLADISGNLTKMGAVLGRPKQAQALVQELQAGLEALRARAPATRQRAVSYAANGYTAGTETLTSEMMEAAGFANVAAEFGIRFGAPMPLELLALSAPDVVMTSPLYPGASRSEEIKLHPVVAAVTAGQVPLQLDSRDWMCGTPLVLRAIRDLAQQREALTLE